MARSRPQHTREQVKEAIKRILAFHRIGGKNLRQRPGRAKYADDETGRDARAVGLDGNTLRAARRFADPTEGYTRAELDQLVALCQESGFAMGRTMIVRLLTIRPKSRRTKFQRRVIQGAWSQRRLELELGKQFGPRRGGGRRRRVPTGRLDLLVQLERQCQSWRRWQAELRRAPEGGGATPDRTLPAGVLRQVNKIGQEIDELHGKVELALGEERPGRRTRADAQGVKAPQR